MFEPLICTLLLPLILFTAALAQAAGGMGFGLIAGPALVLTFGSSAGLQATIMLNLLVALLTWLACHKEVPYHHLLPMVPGLCAGTGVGLSLMLLAPEWAVQMALCLVLGWVCLTTIRKTHQSGASVIKFSLLSGVMAGSLAIPGPAAAVYLKSITHTANAARSAMMPLLFFSYSLAGAGIVSIQGFNEKAIDSLSYYGPTATAGILAGLWLSRRLSEYTLRKLTLGLLFGTLFTLSYTTTSDLSAMLKI